MKNQNKEKDKSLQFKLTESKNWSIKELADQLDRIERMLKWLTWKHTTGADIKRLEDVLGMNPEDETLEKKKRSLYVELLDSEPDIFDILDEIAKEKKDERPKSDPQKN